MNWSTIFSIGVSILNLIAVFMYIKVTNKGYKLRDDHIAELERIYTYQLYVIKLQDKAIKVLQEEIKTLSEKGNK